MNKTLSSLKTLLVASMRMYYRDKRAIVFTLFLPLALLGVFGLISKSSNPSTRINLTNYSNSQLSKSFVDQLSKVPSFQVEQVSESQAADALGKGNIDLQVIVPKQFGATDASGAVQKSALITHYNAGKPAGGIVANLIVSQIVNGINNNIAHTPEVIAVDASGVRTNNLNFFDFILPGILGMTIMQFGIFGVAFAFVSIKASGALRRLQATPVHPRNFIAAQAVTRFITSLATVMILVLFGMKFFGFHMIGSFLNFIVVASLGIIIFLGFGFGIAGYSKDENQVAPIANLIQLPLLFLSGLFFPRDSFPYWLKRITDFLPLTYLADALRKVANEGARLSQIKGDLLGMAIWALVVFVVAINVFRWE